MGLADLKEATTETSSEDIREYAEQLVEEVHKERQGEQAKETKSDARIAAEHAGKSRVDEDTLETPAEDNSSRASAESGEETGDAVESPEWLTDDVKAEAAAYGIEESELADFASREELDRALRLFDKNALEAGRKAMEKSEEGQARNEKGQFVKKEEAKAESPAEASRGDGRYEVLLDKDLYDEEIIDELTRMRDYYESRFEALESHFAEASAKEEEYRFDNAIDKLEMPKLFGVTGKESSEELKRRQDVMAQARVLQAGYRSFGRDVDIASIVARAAPMVFASEFDKHKLKQKTNKISKQSQMRQGGSPTKPLPPREDPRDEADRLYRELERA